MFKGIESFSEAVQKNMRLNYQEMQDRALVLRSYPVKIFIEPTQRCSLDCIICGKDCRLRSGDMSMELFRSIEQQLFPYVAEVDFFMVGEITMARHAEAMLLTARDYSFLPKLFTNGTAMPDRIADLYSGLGVFVTISFDAVTKELFEKIRVNADFDQVVANIRKLRDWQKRSGNPRTHTRLACTIGMYNIEEAPKVIEFARAMDIDDVMFGAYDWKDDTKSWALVNDPGKVVDILKRTKELADKARIRFSCPLKIGPLTIKENHNWHDFALPIDQYAPFELESFNPAHGDCGYPWTQSAVLLDGQVVACCQRHQYAGDLTKQPFLEIWNGERYRRLRNQLSFYRCLGTECRMADYSLWNGGTGRDPALLHRLKAVAKFFNGQDRSENG